MEKILESPLDCKEIQPVHPKGNQSWLFTGRTDAKAKAPIVWPPDAKSHLIRKDPDAGKDWRQKENRTTEDEMVRWHYRLNGHKFDQAPGYVEGQGGLLCCNPWGHKELDMSEWLNNNHKASAGWPKDGALYSFWALDTGSSFLIKFPSIFCHHIHNTANLWIEHKQKWDGKTHNSVGRGLIPWIDWLIHQYNIYQAPNLLCVRHFVEWW